MTGLILKAQSYQRCQTCQTPQTRYFAFTEQLASLFGLQMLHESRRIKKVFLSDVQHAIRHLLWATDSRVLMLCPCDKKSTQRARHQRKATCFPAQCETQALLVACVGVSRQPCPFLYILVQVPVMLFAISPRQVGFICAYRFSKFMGFANCQTVLSDMPARRLSPVFRQCRC